jgi:L-asparaginase
MSNNSSDGSDSIQLFVKDIGHVDYPIEFYQDPRDLSVLEANREKLKLEKDNKGVLVVYTGGTIGSAPRDMEDPDSPQVVKKWDKLKASIPPLNETDIHSINFRIDAVSFADPLDSANVGPLEWNAMAKIIHKYQHDYEGFVIAHGTDTLVYTASALSFMLENLSKPVILTGSQLSAIGHVRNDAQQNLITAILIANASYSKIHSVPEVCIFFRDKLLRGNRTKKIDAKGYAAFDSPNYPPLGRAGSEIEIDEKLVMKPSGQPLNPRTVFNTNVVALDVFPGIQESQVLKKIFEIPNLKGVVLRTFGSGNTSTEAKFLEQIRKATENEIVVLNVTQCSSGGVEMGLYETSAVLLDCGVISGVDMTAEAALCKLMSLLGNEDNEYKDVLLEAQIAQRGEQSHSIRITTFPSTAMVVVDSRKKRYRSAAEDVKTWGEKELIKALLRFDSATIATQDEARLEIKLFVNLNTEEEPDVASPKFAGAFAKPQCSTPQTIIFDITKAAKNNLKPGRMSFTVVIDDDNGIFQWKDAELALYVRE